jgi:hypothetical protein
MVQKKTCAQIPDYKNESSGLQLCAVKQVSHGRPVPFASTSRSDASPVELDGHRCERECAGSADGLNNGN